jgi:hypothetical protein
MGDNQLPPWAVDLVRNVGDKAVRDIVNDFKSYNPSPSMGAAAKVKLEGVGVVQTGTDGAAHTPHRETPSNGWQEAPKVDSWKPNGIDIIDAMCSAQDAVDKAERIKALAEAARHLKALREVEAEQALEAKLEAKGSEK